jgi:predicted molibdopterin-dependent oxidoreductase YjgC
MPGSKVGQGLNREPELHRDHALDISELKDPHLNIRIDQKEVRVPDGISVAAALLTQGIKTFRWTTEGNPRGLFCGMGVCYDCLVTIDGQPDQRACMTLVEEGMQIHTGAQRR